MIPIKFYVKSKKKIYEKKWRNIFHRGENYKKYSKEMLSYCLKC